MEHTNNNDEHFLCSGGGINRRNEMKIEAKLKLHVNGKILTLGLWDRLLRGVVEAHRLGLEQPYREGARGTASQGTALPFAWFI